MLEGTYNMPVVRSAAAPGQLAAPMMPGRKIVPLFDGGV